MPELNLPTPGVTAGPEWASQLNEAIESVNSEVDATSDVIQTGRLSDTQLSAKYVGSVVGKTGGSISARDVREGLGLAVSPVDFGAVGNGTTNDTVAVQAAITWLEANGGGTLLIPRGKRFRITDGIFLVRNSTVPVSIVGEGGALVGGTVTVGPTVVASGGVMVQGMVITGVEFDGENAYGTRTLLRIGCVRGLTISDENYFRRGGIAIETYGDTTETINGFHSLAMLRINKNRFIEVNYAVKHTATAWDYASDWDITDNFVNYAADTSFWIASEDGLTGGVDGLNFQGNVMFHLGSNHRGTARWDSKRYNLRIGKTDWLRIVNNNFFSPGLEAIYLRNLRNFNIVGNNLAWTGSRVKSAAITIDASPSAKGPITGNTISLWSQNAIAIINGTNLSELEIGANEYYFEGYNPQYFGTSDTWRLRLINAAGGTFKLFVDDVATGDIAWDATAGQIQTAINAITANGATVVDNTDGVVNVIVSTPSVLRMTSAVTGTNTTIEVTAYLGDGTLTPRIYADTSALGWPNSRTFSWTGGVRDSIRGAAFQTRDHKNQIQGIGAAYVQRTIGSTATTVFALADMLNIAARAGGLINITVRRAGGTNDMVAHYLLFVAVQSATCTLIASGGRTTGASVDEPSFSWTLDTAGNLKATRVGSTGGSNYHFDAIGVGALMLK